MDQDVKVQPWSNEAQLEIPNVVLSRELEGSSRRTTCQAFSALLHHQPHIVAPQHITAAEQGFNKAFCAAWLDHKAVVVGTKCNQLVHIDTQTRLHRAVPLPPAPRSRDGPDVLSSDRDQRPAGIHTVGVSPCGGYLATGGHCVNDVVVLRTSDLSPVQTFMGHADWIFATSWVSPDCFVTASRDHTIKLWQLQDPQGRGYDDEPAACWKSVLVHKDKARALCYDPQTSQLLSMSVDGMVNIWTPDLQLVQRFTCARDLELVTAAMSGPVIALGSKYHVTLYDARVNNSAGSALVGELEATVHGVRSLVMKEHLLSYGTGEGRITFHDLRYWRSRGPRRSTRDPNASWGSLPLFLRGRSMGRGRFDSPSFTLPAWAGTMPQLVACYAHCWDPSGTKLFAAGGPLAVGLTGCCLVLWE